MRARYIRLSGPRFTRYLIVTVLTALFVLPVLPASAEPAIELFPSAGSPGTNVDVKGTGFLPFSNVTITFDGKTLTTEPETVIANALGTFNAKFEVPPDASPGEKAVEATGSFILEVSSASATFNVVLRNGAPSAVSQSLTVNEDEPTEIKLQASDPDGDNISFTIMSEPGFGLLAQVNPDTGTVVYAPDSDFTGKDKFTFLVNDGRADSNTATISITVVPVNDAPTMDDMTIDISEDTRIMISLMADDSDSSKVSFSLEQGPEHGSLGTISSTGRYSAEVLYSPEINYNGEDSFWINAVDEEGASNMAKVSLNIASVNDAPIALSAGINTLQNQAISLSIAGSDLDGDTLTYIITSNPEHGVLNGMAPELEYEPTANYYGSDEFTFKVNDGTADSNLATFSISVAAVTNPEAPTPPSPGGSEENTSTPPDVSDEPSVPEDDVPEGSGVGSTDDAIPDQGLADAQAPRLALPESPLEVQATSENGAIVTFIVKAEDDQDGEITAHCSPSSGSTFPIGKVNVLCKATDKDGNTSLGSFVVAVSQADGENEGLLSMWMTFLITGIVGAAGYGGFRVVKHGIPRMKA